MKVITWIVLVIIFFLLGWFAHAHHESFSFLKFLEPAKTEENQNTVKPGKGKDDSSLCAQVITPARNPDTGEIKEFPTPCDVPEGWEVIQNDVPGMELEVQ